MKKSIIQDKKECYFCGSHRWLERHHVFGAANRGAAERDGLWVWLCHYCHNEPPDGVHFNRERSRHLKELAQRTFEAERGHAAFMVAYGRNYIDGEI